MPPEVLPSTPPPPEDLKKSLYQELGSQFSTRLASDSAMPHAAKTALSALLSNPAAISSDILSALAAEDVKQEGDNE